MASKKTTGVGSGKGKGGDVKSNSGDFIGSLYDIYNTSRDKKIFEEQMNTAIGNQQNAYDRAKGQLSGAYKTAGDANSSAYNYAVSQYNKTNPQIVKNYASSRDYNSSAINNNLKNQNTYALNEFNKANSLTASNLAKNNATANTTYDGQRGDINRYYDMAANGLDPYAQGGAASSALLTKFLTGDPSVRATDYVKTNPGYEFRLNEGLGSLDKSAAARGGILSGQYLKDITKYGQDYAQTGYNDYINSLQANANAGQTAATSQAGIRQNQGNQLVDARAALGTNLTNNQNAATNANQAANSNYYNTVATNANQATNANMTNNQNYYGNMNQNLSNQFNVLTGLSADYNKGIASNALNRATALSNLDLQNTGYVNDLLANKAQGSYVAGRNVQDATSAGAAALGQIAQPFLSNINLSGALNSGANSLMSGIGSLGSSLGSMLGF